MSNARVSLKSDNIIHIFLTQVSDSLLTFTLLCICSFSVSVISSTFTVSAASSSLPCPWLGARLLQDNSFGDVSLLIFGGLIEYDCITAGYE